MPGTFDGELLKYTNMGDEMEEGAPGDVYIRVKQARHPRFVREGHNLRAEITVSLQ